MASRVMVLRLGHRPGRDPRLTTHVGLTARAFGASGIAIDAQDDETVASLRKVVERFGGPFRIESGVPWKPYVEAWQRNGGIVCHLTMYGEPLEGAMDDLRNQDVLLVVGGPKVPPAVFAAADRNVAVGNQPHSEVAALAVTLDRLTSAGWRRQEFEGARVRIEPNPRGKTLIETP